MLYPSTSIPRKLKPCLLIVAPGKVTVKSVPGNTESHSKNKEIICHSQSGFMKSKSCLSNLISFYNKATCLADEEKAMGIIFLNFSEDFDTITHTILLDKFSTCEINQFMLCWVMYWLSSRAQSVAVNVVNATSTHVQDSVFVGLLQLNYSVLFCSTIPYC